MTERRDLHEPRGRPIEVQIGTLVVERSPGRALDSLQPALLHELLAARVPPDIASDIATAMLAELDARAAP